MAILTDAEIQKELGSLNGWQRNGSAIQRVFRFPDFKAAMQFVNKIAEAAEQANHHPDIDIRYNTVTMALVSHDRGELRNGIFAWPAQSTKLLASWAGPLPGL